MSNLLQHGIFNTAEFAEPKAITNQYSGSASKSYTPTTASNSTTVVGKWYIPSGSIVGDSFQVKVDVTFNGFSSITSTAFTMYFQGKQYTTTSSSAWQGTNILCKALNDSKPLKEVVRTATSGTYTYETDFTLTQDYLNSYVGSDIGLRTDYSNGSGKVTISNIKIIPSKYATSSTAVSRLTNDTIAANNFIEW